MHVPSVAPSRPRSTRLERRPGHPRGGDHSLTGGTGHISAGDRADRDDIRAQRALPHELAYDHRRTGRDADRAVRDADRRADCAPHRATDPYAFADAGTDTRTDTDRQSHTRDHDPGDSDDLTSDPDPHTIAGDAIAWSDRLVPVTSAAGPDMLQRNAGLLERSAGSGRLRPPQQRARLHRYERRSGQLARRRRGQPRSNHHVSLSGCRKRKPDAHGEPARQRRDRLARSLRSRAVSRDALLAALFVANFP